MKNFLIGGTASGVGKTTVTLALIAAMRRRGFPRRQYPGELYSLAILRRTADSSAFYPASAHRERTRLVAI
jgi:hypothetical protein